MWSVWLLSVVYSGSQGATVNLADSGQALMVLAFQQARQALGKWTSAVPGPVPRTAVLHVLSTTAFSSKTLSMAWKSFIWPTLSTQENSFFFKWSDQPLDNWYNSNVKYEVISQKRQLVLSMDSSLSKQTKLSVRLNGLLFPRLLYDNKDNN